MFPDGMTNRRNARDGLAVLFCFAANEVIAQCAHARKGRHFPRP